MMNDTLSSLTGFLPGVLLLCSQHSRDTVHVKTISDLKGKKEEQKKGLKHPKVVSRYLLSHAYIMARMYCEYY